jgi:hypothetical protein
MHDILIGCVEKGSAQRAGEKGDRAVEHRKDAGAPLGPVQNADQSLE